MPELSLVHRTIPARIGPAPHPGLLLLHGHGSNEADMHMLAQEAADPRLFVVSVRGPFSTPWGGASWYDLREHDGTYTGMETISSSIERVQRFLDEMLSAYPIDPDQLSIGGFSQGAAMALALALIQPERVAGAIALSGFLPIHGNLPYRPQAAVDIPIFQGHGIQDQVVPILYGRMTRDYLQSQTPVDLTYHEYPIGHEVSLDELRDLGAWMTSRLDARARQPSADARSTFNVQRST